MSGKDLAKQLERNAWSLFESREATTSTEEKIQWRVFPYRFTAIALSRKVC